VKFSRRGNFKVNVLFDQSYKNNFLEYNINYLQTVKFARRENFKVKASFDQPRGQVQKKKDGGKNL